MHTERKSSNIETPLHQVLAATFEHGDQTSIAEILHVKRQQVQDWETGERRNPFESAALIVETLRRNRNANSEKPFLTLAWRLGYIVCRSDEKSIDDAGFASLLREFSEVVESRAAAERDGRITAEERRRIADQVAELIERASAYRHGQLEKAAAEEIRRVS